MRNLLWIPLLWIVHQVNGQGFECDGSFYIVVYTRSIGVSTLYRIEQLEQRFVYHEIRLSEDRRLNALSYNVLDKFLYALDVDTYELVRLHPDGLVTSLGVPENLDQNLSYNAATISPDGAGIYLLAYSDDMQSDIRFYTINLSRTNLYSGYLGVTGERPVSIHDFATDPITGIMYGYDNREGTLTQIGIGGEVAALKYPTTGVRSVDGMFFDRSGELYAYSARNGLYSINKRSGEMRFIEKGPEGSLGDGCSCPYTYSFEKDIAPRQIIECGNFEVTYSFNNQLGIGQTWLDLRDTFPPGFEIVDITSKILTPSNVIESPSNVLALENMIYVMGENNIVVNVKSPPGFTGVFSGNAKQWDFPLAFDEIQYSDDPLTADHGDQTSAEVVGLKDVSVESTVTYSCDRMTATLAAAAAADRYEWSTGDSTYSTVIGQPGTYILRASNDCITYVDTVFIDQFPEPYWAEVSGDNELVLGGTGNYAVTTDMDGILSYAWSLADSTLLCSCPAIDLTPTGDFTLHVEVSNQRGCTASASVEINTKKVRHTYAPNVFSPNDDGINDRFFIQSSTSGVMKTLKIFNRWGNMVYDANQVPINDEYRGWDGMMEGRTLPTGVYIWVAEIRYFDGFEEVKHGEIVLIGQ